MEVEQGPPGAGVVVQAVASPASSELGSPTTKLCWLQEVVVEVVTEEHVPGQPKATAGLEAGLLARRQAQTEILELTQGAAHRMLVALERSREAAILLPRVGGPCLVETMATLVEAAVVGTTVVVVGRTLQTTTTEAAPVEVALWSVPIACSFPGLHTWARAPQDSLRSVLAQLTAILLALEAVKPSAGRMGESPPFVPMARPSSLTTQVVSSRWITRRS